MRITRFAIAAAVVALAGLTAGCTLPERGTPPGSICYGTADVGAAAPPAEIC